MKILIYGSTFLTEKVVNILKDKHELVGYVPSVNPTFKGNIELPIVSEDTPCDIKLSIQYDRKITDTDKSYNLHTGLLPDYGGCDIIYHTLENKEKEQGLTFHKISKDFDAGSIVSKISYPVFEDDTAIDLYKRLCVIAPYFLLSSIELLNILPKLPEGITPTIYKKGMVSDMRIYENDYQAIKKYTNDTL